MAVSPRRFLRELNLAAAFLLLASGALCIGYSNNRGIVQLSYSVNNTDVHTTLHSFSVGMIYATMLGFSSMHHIILAKWPGRTIRDLKSGGHVDRWIAFSVVLPTTSMATVVGIASVTDVFAVYAAAAIASVLVFALWISATQQAWLGTRVLILAAAVALFLTFWLFVWAQTVRFTAPLLMYSVGTVLMLLVALLIWKVIKRRLTREAVLINVSVGLQLGCAGVWAAMHHSLSASAAPFRVFVAVLLIFAAMCIFAVFRVNGTLIAAVNDAELELTKDLIPAISDEEDEEDEDDGVFGPSVAVSNILNANATSTVMHNQPLTEL